MLTIMLVGSPNVGKSMIFNYLTGLYVTVSNYPGTTVDISRGKLTISDLSYEVIDTPGIYSLHPLTEEERVTRRLLCDGNPKLIIQVIDTKHIRRMTNLTLELIDAGYPLIVCLNVIDEAERLGMSVDACKLATILGVPVVKTSAVSGVGLENLRRAISQFQYHPPCQPKFTSEMERKISEISDCIKNSGYGISTRMAAILLLQGDSVTKRQARQEIEFAQIVQLIADATKENGNQLDVSISSQRQTMVDNLLAPCIHWRKKKENGLAEAVSKITRQPLTGLPILFLVLYCGLYLFVGRFGAGVLVDYIDKVMFGRYLLPTFINWVLMIPNEAVQTVLLGEFGVVSLGLRYAIAIILPVVSTFFLAFAIMEDSGYLPRLAMLLNGVCRWVGLNGRAVIPLSLGFGCGTMAVMVTRTLETKRERILTTFLLALAIPCSAQLGVILALLSQNQTALLLWACTLIVSFLLAGFFANCLLPGRQSGFYMELPPIRLPRLSNVCIKAYSRMVWYMREIIPVFIVISLILWLTDYLGLIDRIADSLQPILALLGLPRQLAPVFLLGFFRRDYGAAGLYDLMQSGFLSEKQLLVSAVGLTLFLPCIAQLVVTVKERGVAVALSMLLLIALYSFIAAWIVHMLVSPAWL